MDLTDDEIRDLAAFLARRLLPDGTRPDPTDAPAAGRTPLSAWVDALRDARTTGRVPAVLRRAASHLPEDRALQEACTLVRDERRGPHLESLAAGALFVVAAAGLALLAVTGFSTVGVLYALEATAPGPAVDVSADRLHPNFPTTPPVVPVAAVASVADPSVADAATRAGDVGPVALAPVVAPGLPASRVATRVPRVEDGPPEGPLEQGCSGWFYAGTEDPGEVGSTVAIPHRVNVRAAHPSRENGWDRRARVRCVLEPGQVVRLSGSPVALPGGHYWAPLSEDSVVRPVDVAFVSPRGR